MLKKLNIRTVTLTTIVLLLSLCMIACQGQTDGRTQEEPPRMGHILSGSADSPVRIEVFSDLQCPACRELFLRTIQPIMSDYGDKVSVVYHEFPLSMHQFARPAARYVAAAAKLGQQDSLLSVYDAIFSDRDRWVQDGSLENSVARALSRDNFLRVRQFLQDEDSLAAINENIEKEVQFGIRRGINATPTMFIFYNGGEERIEGVPNYQSMKQSLDRIIN